MELSEVDQGREAVRKAPAQVVTWLKGVKLSNETPRGPYTRRESEKKNAPFSVRRLELKLVA